jgi:hypothetical protein
LVRIQITYPRLYKKKSERERERKSVILVRWELLILICIYIYIYKLSRDSIPDDTKKENAELRIRKTLHATFMET